MEMILVLVLPLIKYIEVLSCCLIFSSIFVNMAL